MIRNIIVCFSLAVLALSNVSFRWPLNNPVITSTFGESRGDHFHDGMDFVSSDSRVFPVKEGKLLYAWNRSLFPLDNYWGGGNYKVIQHDDDYVSVYMHLQDGEPLQMDYADSDVIGLVGNTGRSYGSHIHFSILNRKLRYSINPFKVMTEYSDTKAPEILYFYIRIDDRYVRINPESSIRLTQHYPLLVEIKDSASGRERVGIYKMKVLFNGNEVLNTEYDRIDYSDNGFTVSGRVFADLFDDKGYYKIPDLKYQEGLNTFTVTAYDFSGNTAEKVFNINVSLDTD